VVPTPTSNRLLESAWLRSLERFSQTQWWPQVFKTEAERGASVYLALLLGEIRLASGNAEGETRLARGNAEAERGRPDPTLPLF